MTTKGDVHWEEGLFLQQHHLQMAQRRSFEDRADDRRLSRPYPYGIVEIELSPDELRNMVVRFTALRVVMPSGVIIDHPNNTEIPPLDISEAFQSSPGGLDLSLALPNWYPARGNSLAFGPNEDRREKRLFRVREVERHDENTGESPQMVRVREFNARVLLPDEDPTDLEVLPLLRIVQGAGQDVGLPREDPQHVAATYAMRGSRRLSSMVRDLSNSMQASRRSLVSQMTRGGWSIDTMRGVQFEQMFRLRTLSKYGKRLENLLNAQVVTPFDMYLDLVELLGELAALHPDNDQYGVPEYDHDAPMVCFAETIDRIRALLVGSVAPNFVKVDFAKSGPVYEAELTDDHFTKAREYFLAVKSGEDAVQLAKLVTDDDTFKLMPGSMTGRAVRGVKLIEERHPPMQLPVDPSVQFFRLATADSMRAWDRIKNDKKMTAQWPDSEVSDMSLTLYMPVSDGGGSQ